MSFSAFLFYFLTRFWAENWIASLTSRQLIFLIPSQNFNRELSLLRNNCHQHLKALCHCPEFYPVPLVVMRAGSNELNHFNYTQTWPQVTWHSLSQHSDTLCFTSLVFSQSVHHKFIQHQSNRIIGLMPSNYGLIVFLFQLYNAMLEV